MSNKDFWYFLQVVHDGLTGRISIKNGLRDSVNLAIIRLDTSGTTQNHSKLSKYF